MEFQLSCFKSEKMMLLKCCTQYASKFGKFSSGHKTGKGPFSFQSQSMAMPKNAQTTGRLCSSHTLARSYSKSFKPGFNSIWVLLNPSRCSSWVRKGRGTRDQIANICWIIETAREFQKNIYFGCTESTKAFDCVDHNKLWKTLKEMGIQDHLTCLLSNLYVG